MCHCLKLTENMTKDKFLKIIFEKLNACKTLTTIKFCYIWPWISVYILCYCKSSNKTKIKKKSIKNQIFYLTKNAIVFPLRQVIQHGKLLPNCVPTSSFYEIFYNTNCIEPIKIWISSAPYYPHLSEAHLKPRQASKVDRLTIFAKRLILNVS